MKNSDKNAEEFGAEEETIKTWDTTLLSHSCNHCGRRFGSGKALGGHLRIHRRRSSSAAESDDSEKAAAAAMIACHNCGKKFPSRKSVVAHMKTHPGGRGLRLRTQHPPPPPPPGTFFSSVKQVSTMAFPTNSSSSTLSDSSGNHQMMTMHHDFNAIHVSGGGQSTNTDYIQVLKKVEDEEEEEAELGATEQKTVRFHLYSSSSKLLAEDDSWNRCYSVPYSCNICGETFLTYQALGGHASSHNKKLMRRRRRSSKEAKSSSSDTIVALIDKISKNNNNSKIKKSTDKEDGSKSLLKFDLNELPPMEEDQDYYY